MAAVTVARRTAPKVGPTVHFGSALVGPAVAFASLLAWMLVAPRSPDLAAQYYRTWLFRHEGFTLFDNAWYDGHAIPGYSLLFPPFASLVGLRASGLIAPFASTLLFGAILRRRYGRSLWQAEAAFALAASGDAWIGRLSFALGVTFALAAVWVRLGGSGTVRRVASGVLAGVCSAASPVAGLLLLFFALLYAPLVAVGEGAGWRQALRALPRWGEVAVGSTVVAVGMQALFPEGGHEPYGYESLIPALGACVAFAVALPRGRRAELAGAALYALLNLLCEVPTAMGSNAERFGVLLGAPLLLCALYGTGKGLRSSRLPAPLAICAVGGLLCWVVWGPITQSLDGVAERGVRSAFYRPLERWLARHHPSPVRIEVPFTRSHWEAAFLARREFLARGWERQLDKLYNRQLEFGLSPASYHRWLERNGVSYVALPALPLDPSSALERKVILGRPSYLRPVGRFAGWTVYAVRHPAPLVVGLARANRRGATLGQLDHEAVAVVVRRPGNYLLKVHYTPYWSVLGGGRVREGAYRFTVLTAPRPGRYFLSPKFSMAAAWRAIEQFFGLL